MKFYTSTYDYVQLWGHKDGLIKPKDIIPQGTIFKVIAMDMMGLVLLPISKEIKVTCNLTFSPEMIKYGFTETDYID